MVLLQWISANYSAAFASGRRNPTLIMSDIVESSRNAYMVRITPLYPVPLIATTLFAYPGTFHQRLSRGYRYRDTHDGARVSDSCLIST